MCFVIKNVNRVVLICATHVQQSAILCSQELIKLLCFGTTVGDNVTKLQIVSCDQQTWETKKYIIKGHKGCKVD